MSIVNRLKMATVAFRSGSQSWDTLKAIMGMNKSNSGVEVNSNSILTLSAAWNAQVITSETMSTVPLQIFKKDSKGREEYSDNSLYEVLHLQANPTESAQTFRQRFVWDLELYGIALAEIIRDGQGRIRRLWHIPSSDLSDIELRGEELWFHINQIWMPASKVFYCYGPGQNGLSPRSRLKVMNETIGLGMAANEFGSRFFSNGTHLGGFIEYPKKMSDIAFNRAKADINDKYHGLGNANKLIFLEEGLKYQKSGNTNNDSQFLETRQFQIGEVARFYNIPQHLLGDLTNATFSNIEHQGIQAVRYSWRPRAIRIEQAINSQLINKYDRKSIYVEHNLNGLMQGDLKSQMDAWHLGIQDGIFNADEVRSWLNMNHQPNEQGGIYFMPANMYNKQDVKDGKTLKSDSNQRNKEEIVEKINYLPESINKPTTIDGFRAYASSLIPSFVEEYKSRFDEPAYTKSIEKLISSLEKRSKDGIGDEFDRMRNAFKYSAMQASGVKKGVWRSKPDCPYCQHLNGQTRNINETFIDGIRHPPIVSGCTCDIEEAI